MDYEGIPINSDYRIGIQITQAMADPELLEVEKMGICTELLFGSDDEGATLPPPEIAVKGIAWFLSGWYTDRHGKEKDSTPVTDFDIDQWRIYAAFLSQYHIDLNTEDMHYWKFMALLTTLEECAYTRVIDIRMKKLDPKASAKEREQMAELKARYALEEKESAEERIERERLRKEFFSQVTIHRGNSDG